MKSTLKYCIATLVLICATAFGEYIDQIGPDPMRSENCIVVTPHDSMICFGTPDSVEFDGTPILTIGCDANFLSLTLQHQPSDSNSHLRKITLMSDHGALTSDWLAASSTVSLMRLIYGESDEENYYWVLRLMGVLATPEISKFGYVVEDSDVSGWFEFEYSDQKLMELIIPSCT